ncbi:hypothetical protein VNO77_03414 [Canavalia gladiata]|uniref:Uncharacterized protein n=1 Tax=Canavalia gladiata TaxID=3824 RepID=A0AAN9MUN8_CANGL
MKQKAGGLKNFLAGRGSRDAREGSMGGHRGSIWRQTMHETLISRFEIERLKLLEYAGWYVESHLINFDKDNECCALNGRLSLWLNPSCDDASRIVLICTHVTSMQTLGSRPSYVLVLRCVLIRTQITSSFEEEKPCG